MANPTLVARTLEVGNASETGGRWILDHLAVATVSVNCSESGVEAYPFVKFVIDWGDGSIEQSDFLPVGRDFFYSHSYNQGEYIIQIRAINSSGEVSVLTSNATATVRVMPPEGRQVSLKRWIGLGLPAKRLSTASEATQELFPVTTHTLASVPKLGSFEIIVSGGVSAESNSEVTIWQSQRRVTYGRIVKDEGNGRFQLTTPVQDLYDKNLAHVEIRRRSYSTVESTKDLPDPSWAFPVTYDLDLVKASLIMLLGTRIGERVMRPSIGSRIPELVFEQSSPLLDQLAVAYVGDAIAFDPRLAISSARVEDNGPNGRRVLVESSLTNAPEQVFEAAIPLSITTDPI